MECDDAQALEDKRRQLQEIQSRYQQKHDQYMVSVRPEKSRVSLPVLFFLRPHEGWLLHRGEVSCHQHHTDYDRKLL